MRQRHLGIVLAPLLAFAAATLHASETGGIRIDVLVFNNPGVEAAPYWQDSHPLPPCHAVALREVSGAEAAFTDPGQCERKPGFDPAYGGFLITGDNALPAQAARLKSAGHSLLVNRYWQQAGTNLAPVVLRGGGTRDGRRELEGTVVLSGATSGVSLTLELVLTRLDGEQPAYTTLKETRFLKFGEMHYFDHALFGVVLQVGNAP